MDGDKCQLKRSWNVCKEVPIIQDEQTSWKLLKLLKFFSLLAVSLLVFSLAICSKTTFLLLITLSSNATQTIPAAQKPLTHLCVSCVLIGPSVLLLIKSFWKVIFKGSKKPAWTTVAWVLCVDFLVALGSAVLAVVAMPFLDIVTNVMILNGVSILSSVFQVVAQCFAGKEKNKFFLPSIFSVILSLLGYVLFLTSSLLGGKREMVLMSGLAIAGAFLVSLNWWENYCSHFKGNFFSKLSEDIARSRNVLHILSSLLRIVVTATVVGVYIYLSDRNWSTLTSVPGNVKTVVLVLTLVQVFSSALCHWFVVVACKMHALRRGFILPLYLASLGVLAVFITPVMIRFQKNRDLIGDNYTITAFCQETMYSSDNKDSWYEGLVLDVAHSLCKLNLNQLRDMGLLGGAAFCWWLGLILSTSYIGFLKFQRIQRTQDLFVRRMYEGGFVEQSMLLNSRFKIQKTGKSNKAQQTDPVKVLLCATMWHETDDEMMKMIISMFRLDQYRPKNEGGSKDVDFESHVFFDDAFRDVRGTKEPNVNEYAETLVRVIREVYSIFDEGDYSLFKERTPLPSQKVLKTPYGGRLEFTLPHGNKLTVHFKNKQLIRHKKRWSQIMYLYYLLGWNLTTKYHRMFEKIKDEEGLNKKLEKEKHNTYLLALDGDTDFQPAAVMLLIDRLRNYPHVGAVCGRIHPTGTGPMVWYQKFEYAVGHWLQKTAEHVFGCVLCSPGCFSLFRAAGLMDDNVMKKYTTKATEASHFVQYDQGEDRWLCTLLLQQGWRVEYNAASDAYTNAPQDFKEFYNQRRRWGPSTLANTIDLLGSGSVTSRRNSSISKLYILYQILSTASSILGPATIVLMTGGSLAFVLNIPANGALLLAVVPPIIYLVVCFRFKSDTQITVAAVMSVFYAFLMLGTVLSIIGAMVKDGTIWTPSGLFFTSIVLMNVVTAVMHPQEFQLIIYGILYFVCIPSAYLLLAIYSMVNMNNVSWGTRETGSLKPTASPPPATTNLFQRCLKFKGCNRCCEKDHSQELDELEFWRELLKVYLEPLPDDKEKQKKITEDLKDLRNKVTFVYFIVNALWLVATFVLQIIGAPVTIQIPKTDIHLVATGEVIYLDPIGLMFLLGFALVLLMQFVGMIYHR
ncbi:chitin synthase chs-2-like [Aplochiton taeniatus]